MSDLDGLSFGIELTERIAGDIAHAVPVAGSVLGYGKKTLSKKKIILNIQAGQTHLHKVSKTLLDSDNLEALMHIKAYEMLMQRYSVLSDELSKTRQLVDAVKMYQIFQKRQLYKLSVKQTQGALELKLEVWTKSDMARLQLQQSRLGLPTSTAVNQPSTSAAPVRLTSPSEVTLVSLAPPRNLTISPPGDSSYDDDDSRSVYSDTNSMHGNPWLNHVVLDSSNQSDDAQSMTPLPSASDKGKGRAVGFIEEN